MNPEKIQQIDGLLNAWKAGQPLSDQATHALHSKQDLLWSYNSNHLEGNTLSYGETELLLIHGEVTGNHSARDVDEMRAHHVAVATIREWAHQDREITEADIRAINKILLKEPFTKETVTETGLRASRIITPGVYKNEPNHVKTVSGELFRFAEPFEVPSKMEVFTKNLREPLPDNAFDIAARLARLHHEFILIHPFDDGNGRTVRLLLNYALLRDGLPAIVIKSADKAQYLQALRLADAGEYDSLVEFLLNCIQYALDLGIKAMKGESLAEPDDADMKLALLKKRLLSQENQGTVTTEQQWDFCQNYILPYFTQFCLKFAQKDDLFGKNDRNMFIFGIQDNEFIYSPSEFQNYIAERKGKKELLRKINIEDQSRGFLGKCTNRFDVYTKINFSFEPIGIFMDGKQLPYDSILTESEANALVSEKLEKLIKEIESRTK